MKANAGFWVGCVLISIVLSGCNRYQVIPDHLAKQVNEQLSYEQVKDSPETYRGQIVVWGGEVLSAVRQADRTKIEVLQMPLNKDYVPGFDKALSHGRFSCGTVGRRSSIRLFLKRDRKSPLSARLKGNPQHRPTSCHLSRLSWSFVT